MCTLCGKSLVHSFSSLFSIHSEKILKLATNIARQKLVSVGTCFGKFTKTSKFRLHITALDFLAPYAKVTFSFFEIALFLLSSNCRCLIKRIRVLDNAFYSLFWKVFIVPLSR